MVKRSENEIGEVATRKEHLKFVNCMCGAWRMGCMRRKLDDSSNDWRRRQFEFKRFYVFRYGPRKSFGPMDSECSDWDGGGLAVRRRGCVKAIQHHHRQSHDTHRPPQQEWCPRADLLWRSWSDRPLDVRCSRQHFRLFDRKEKTSVKFVSNICIYFVIYPRFQQFVLLFLFWSSVLWMKLDYSERPSHATDSIDNYFVFKSKFFSHAES